MKTASGTEIVKRIDDLLYERCETRVDLSKAVNIGTVTISHWFSRDSVPKIDDIFNIADYLNVPVEYLAFGTKTTKSETTDKLARKIERLSESEKATVEILIDGILNKKGVQNN